MMLTRFSRVFVTALFMAASGGLISFAQSKGQSPRSEPLKIGFSLDSLKLERWQTDLAAFQKRAQELGAKVIVESADGNDDLQFRQAQKLLRSGITVLVLVPHDTGKAARIVRAAKVRHVPVLCYDRMVRNSSVDFFVGFDNHAVGKLQAATLTEHAPKGNYVLIGGSPVDANAQAVRDGQMEVLKPLIDRGDIKVVADFWATDWNPLEAYVHMGEALDSTKGEITAVVASNDGTAGGAIQALENYKLAGKVLVSGQDADLAAIIRILDGTQTMTVYKPLGNAARQAAEVAVRLARGKHIKATASISDGARHVPAILFPANAVTKDNVMQTVVKDGFQNLDTIKQNLPKEKWPE